MVITNCVDFINNYHSYNNCSVIIIAEDDYILLGKYSEYNKNNKYNLKKLETNHFGGTIINFKNDICVCNFSDNDNDFGFKFMCDLSDYLAGKNINCYLDGNDLMVDGYKTASFMSTDLNNKVYTAIHIPLNINLDIICDVCSKDMIKTPTSLTNYSIKFEDVLNFCKNFIERYEYDNR